MSKGMIATDWTEAGVRGAVPFSTAQSPVNNARRQPWTSEGQRPQPVRAARTARRQLSPRAGLWDAAITVGFVAALWIVMLVLVVKAFVWPWLSAKFNSAVASTTPAVVQAQPTPPQATPARQVVPATPATSTVAPKAPAASTAVRPVPAAQENVPESAPAAGAASADAGSRGAGSQAELDALRRLQAAL